MPKLLVVLVTLLFLPHTQVLSIEETNKVLGVSVLLRVKQYMADTSGKVKKGLIGCSGTYVGPNVVLTAGHCFQYPSTDIWVQGPDEASKRGYLSKLDVAHDLALVVVQGKGHKFAVVADKMRVGEKVVNVGSPLRFKFLLSEGILASTKASAYGFTSTYIVTTAMVNPGSSGGGAFNEAGELLGVNTLSVGGLFGWAGITMAVDADTIREFLN